MLSKYFSLIMFWFSFVNMVRFYRVDEMPPFWFEFGILVLSAIAAGPEFKAATEKLWSMDKKVQILYCAVIGGILSSLHFLTESLIKHV